MKIDSEIEFGRALLQLVAHLLKNAEKVPEPVLKGALEFEAFTWGKQDVAAKRTRLNAIAELTEAPSEVHRHMEAYPHPFSKKRYAEYLTALRLYKESLAI